MPLTNNAKHVALDALGNTNPAIAITHGSLHDGDPSTTGANEISGGSPAYARQPITWNAAASGQKTMNGTLVFDVPGGTTIQYFGMFSAVSAGSFMGSSDITDEVFGAQGQYTLTALTLALNDS